MWNPTILGPIHLKTCPLLAMLMTIPTFTPHPPLPLGQTLWSTPVCLAPWVWIPQCSHCHPPQSLKHLTDPDDWCSATHPHCLIFPQLWRGLKSPRDSRGRGRHWTLIGHKPRPEGRLLRSKACNPPLYVEYYKRALTFSVIVVTQINKCFLWNNMIKIKEEWPTKLSMIRGRLHVCIWSSMIMCLKLLHSDQGK